MEWEGAMTLYLDGYTLMEIPIRRRKGGKWKRVVEWMKGHMMRIMGVVDS